MNHPPTDLVSQFENEKKSSIATYPNDQMWQELSRQWLKRAFEKRFMYNFVWLGRPIIQTPIDVMAMQELIWSAKPDLIVESGIAHGGSLVFSASMLALLDYCEATAKGEMCDPSQPRRRVLGLDIDIRAHNRAAIKAHPMASRIDMIEGSSVASEIIAHVREIARGYQRVLVCLDSNHTHEHVLAELEAYAPLTSRGSYCVVFDTIVEDLPEGMFPDRPWGKGNNPKTAVWEYLRRLEEEGRTDLNGVPLDFEIDKSVETKLLITVAPDGFLKRI